MEDAAGRDMDSYIVYSSIDPLIRCRRDDTIVIKVYHVFRYSKIHHRVAHFSLYSNVALRAVFFQKRSGRNTNRGALCHRRWWVDISKIKGLKKGENWRKKKYSGV